MVEAKTNDIVNNASNDIKEFIKENGSVSSEYKFKLAKKTSHLDLLKYHNAIALNKSYTCK